MTGRASFLTWVNSQLREAEIAIHNGDASPRRAIWSRNDPVTVFGAWKSASGPAEIETLFSSLEQTFSECKAYSFEIVAADVVGDLAYTVGYEHTQAVINGENRTYKLRATQIYRRENGEWMVVHRHADTVSDDTPTNGTVDN